MRGLVVSVVSLAACYPGVDNSDCAIRCGADEACPSNLSCVSTFCVEDGQTCVDPDLVLAYSFELEDGTVVDQSGNGNTAGIEGAPMLIDGVHGNAMAFDGMNDQLITRHSPSLAVAPGGAFTVSFWIRVESRAPFPGDQLIVGKVRDNDNTVSPFYEFGIELDMTSEKLELFLSDGTEFFAAEQVAVPFGAFAHVAFTWDGTVVRGYLDGVEQTDFDPGRDFALDIPDFGNNFVVGANPGPKEFFLGAMDDLRLYNRVLSAAEIAADSNSSVTR